MKNVCGLTFDRYTVNEKVLGYSQQIPLRVIHRCDIHSFSSLSYDRSTDTPKASSPHTTI